MSISRGLFFHFVTLWLSIQRQIADAFAVRYPTAATYVVLHLQQHQRGEATQLPALVATLKAVQKVCDHLLLFESDSVKLFRHPHLRAQLGIGFRFQRGFFQLAILLCRISP